MVVAATVEGDENNFAPRIPNRISTPAEAPAVSGGREEGDAYGFVGAVAVGAPD